MKLATVAESPFRVLWALIPTLLSKTTEVGSILQLCPLLHTQPPAPPTGHPAWRHVFVHTHMSAPSKPSL